MKENIHLFIDACNTNLQIKRIWIHADISLKEDLTDSHKLIKVNLIKMELEAVLNKFFDNGIEYDVMSNDEYNKMMETNGG